MNTIKTAGLTLVFIFSIFFALPGIRQVYACSYNYQPESLSAFSHVGNNYLPVQNPPSILQIVDFSLSTNCYPDSANSSWNSAGKSFSTESGNIQISGTGNGNGSELGTNGDTEKFYGEADLFYNSVGQTVDSQSTDDSVIDSITKNGGYTINFTATSNDNPPKTKVVSTFVKATNCVALGNANGSTGGEKKIIFERGDALNLSISDYMNLVYSGIGFFNSISPYKEYSNHFSFYVDLQKIPQNLGPQDGNGDYTDQKGISNLVNAKSSCGSGAYVYVLFANPSGWSNYGQFLRDAGDIILMNIPKIQTDKGAIPFGYVFTHESSHKIGNLSDEYKLGNKPRWLEISAQIVGLTPHNNCSPDPNNDFSFNNYRYGLPPGSDNKGCDIMTTTIGGDSFYRPSVTSLMNKTVGALSNNLNVVSCGYVVSGILDEPTDKAHAENHWAECENMPDTIKDGYLQLGLPPTITTIVNSVPSLTFKITGSGFTQANNSVKLTTAPAGSSYDASSLLATPESFFAPVFNFFRNMRSFFIGLIPHVHGQTTTASDNSYIIDSIPADNANGTSITFTIPTSTPNGVYSVAVDSANSSWNYTNFLITINGGTATVSGNPGIGSGFYTDGATVQATPSYTCPANTSDAIYTLSNTTCTLTPISHNTGGFSTVTICPAGQVAVGGMCIPAAALSFPATLVYKCPTVPPGISGAFTLNNTTCTFHFINSTTNPVSNTPSSASVTYSCNSGDTLIGTTCTRARIMCTADIPPSCQNSTYNATPRYSCPTGYTLSGTTCNLIGEATTTTTINTNNSSPNIEVFSPLPNSTITNWSPQISWGSAVTCSYGYADSGPSGTVNCANNGSDIVAPPYTGTIYLLLFATDASGLSTSTTMIFNYVPTSTTTTVTTTGTASTTNTTTSPTYGNFPPPTNPIILLATSTTDLSTVFMWSDGSAPVAGTTTTIVSTTNTIPSVINSTTTNDYSCGLGYVTVNGVCQIITNSSVLNTTTTTTNTGNSTTVTGSASTNQNTTGAPGPSNNSVAAPTTPPKKSTLIEI